MATCSTHLHAEVADVRHGAIGGDTVQPAVVSTGDETVTSRIGRESEDGTVVDRDGCPLAGRTHLGDPHGTVAEREAGAPSVEGKTGSDHERVEVAGGATGFQQESGFGGLAHDGKFFLYLMAWTIDMSHRQKIGRVRQAPSCH